MNEYTPGLVVMRKLVRSGLARIGEFRLEENGDVTLTVFDPGDGSLAWEIYENGAEEFSTGRRTMPADGPAFMRQLVQSAHSSYIHLIDESAEPAVTDTYLPIRVGVHDEGDKGLPLAAEFRLTDANQLALIMFRASGSRIAWRMFDEGIESASEARLVTWREGPAFMRALLESGHGSQIHPAD